MAEETRRRLPQIARDNTRSESLEETVKNSISRLQSSIRQGLALNRREIKASTSAILAVQETLAQAFNINTDLIEIEKEKMRLAEERRREDERKKNQKQKDDKGFIAKAKGGLFDVLKKVFFGTALVGAAMVVLENWDTIVETFEKIKPTLIAFKDGVVEFATVAIPFLIDNFDVIAKTMAGGALAFGALKIGEKIMEGAKAFGNAVKNAGSNIKALGKRITTVFGRVFLPITAAIVSIMGFIDGFKETEGDIGDKIIGGLKGGVQSLSDFFITGTLNLLKDLTSWLAGAMGFNETAENIASFDPKQYVDEVLGFVFGFIDSAASVIRDLFNFGEEDKTILGALGKLTDIVLVPLNTAITFVRDMFGFSEEEQEPFSLREFITEKITSAIDKVKSFFSNAFSGIGDFSDIKMPEFKIPEFELPTFDIDFPNPFQDIGQRIRQLDFSAFNLGKWFGGALDLNIGDKLKSKLSDIFTGESSAIQDSATVSGGLSGAEVDVRSREVASQTAQPNVTVAAPQTNMSTDNSVRVNKTSVASASPRRNSKPWWAGRNYATN